MIEQKIDRMRKVQNNREKDRWNEKGVHRMIEQKIDGMRKVQNDREEE